MNSTNAVITAADVLTEARRRHDAVTVYELADTYESMQDNDHRRKHGVYYTPEPVAQFTSGFTVDLALSRHIGPGPDEVLRLVICDPACGAGQFLVEATRQLATAFAGRLVDGDPDVELIAAVTPTVITECVFGIDLDPVAAELARTALSWETAGALTPADLERHVIAGDALAGVEPPAMADRLNRAETGDSR